MEFGPGVSKLVSLLRVAGTDLSKLRNSSKVLGQSMWHCSFTLLQFSSLTLTEFAMLKQHFAKQF
jgi:hypothetical protein